jgi:hypothetical protein
MYLDAILALEASAGRDRIDQINVLEDEALEAAQWRDLARKAVLDHVATHT